MWVSNVASLANGGFLKMLHSQIIHFTLGFSTMNHPAIGLPPHMEMLRAAAKRVAAIQGIPPAKANVFARQCKRLSWWIDMAKVPGGKYKEYDHGKRLCLKSLYPIHSLIVYVSIHIKKTNSKGDTSLSETSTHYIVSVVLFPLHQYYIPNHTLVKYSCYAFGWVKDAVHTEVEKMQAKCQLQSGDGQRPYRLSRREEGTIRRCVHRKLWFTSDTCHGCTDI